MNKAVGQGKSSRATIVLHNLMANANPGHNTALHKVFPATADDADFASFYIVMM